MFILDSIALSLNLNMGVMRLGLDLRSMFITGNLICLGGLGKKT